MKNWLPYPPDAYRTATKTPKRRAGKPRTETGITRVTTITFANGARAFVAEDDYFDGAEPATIHIGTASTPCAGAGSLAMRSIYANAAGALTTVLLYGATRAGDATPIHVESELVPSTPEKPIRVAGASRRKVHRVLRGASGRIEGVETFE